MARPATNKSQETKTEQDTTVLLEQKDKEISELKQQFESMQKMMAQLLESQKSQPEVEQKKEVIKDEETVEEIEISPTKLIRIISLTHGGLNLKVREGAAPIQLRDFGSDRQVRFEDLHSIVDNHHDAARNGMFYITDKTARKALYLDDEYEKILKKEDIEKIMSMPVNEITRKLENTTPTIRNTIYRHIIEGIANGKEGFGDYNKIRAVSDYAGQNLEELAQNLR